MTYETILYTVSDRVSTITLNRPEKGNAFSPQMEAELRAALYRAQADEGVRAILLTGAGRAFCVGADMGALQSATEAPTRVVSTEPDPEPRPEASLEANFERRLSYILRISKPIVAAINGPLAGVGFSLALYCDIRFMLDTAVLSTSFARRGLVAEHGASWLLPRLIGPMNALDLLLSARKVTGTEAAGMGLVRALPADTLMAVADRYSADLANLSSPRSMGIIKRQVYDAMFQNLAEAVEISERELALAIETEDFREGVAHFVERRTPDFTGR